MIPMAVRFYGKNFATKDYFPCFFGWTLFLDQTGSFFGEKKATLL